MGMQINFVPVVVAAIASMVVGFLWYGPLFGKVWMSLSKVDEAKLKEMQQKGMGPAYAISLLMALVMAYVLACFAKGWATGVTGAFHLAFWPWLGFVVTTNVTGVLWEEKPWGLYFLSVAHSFVSIFVMALILVFWP